MKKTMKFFWIVCLVLSLCTLMFTACDEEEKPNDTNNTTDDGGSDEHVHAFGEWTVTEEATCTEKGEKERTCSCGEKESESIEALGHTEVVDSALEPTCTAEGKTEGKHCSVCNKVLAKQEVIKAKGHTFVDGFCSCGATNIPVSSGLEYDYVLGPSDIVIGYCVVGRGSCNDTDIVIPSTYRGYSIIAINYGAFSNDCDITSVTLPNSLMDIGRYAFDGCLNLVRINIPNNVEYIGESAFAGCTSLTSITIPDSVECIYEYAFSCCLNLKSITIPDSVISIEQYAFEDCSNLTDITYTGTTAQWNAILKYKYWDSGMGNYTIYCLDETITK